MNIKAKGIVTKLSDYKEADKVASVFTLEEGLIRAKFNGVKKEKAKLKAIAMNFAFADFDLNKNGNFYTVTSASLNDSFNGLMNNYNKMICGYVVLDIINSVLPHEKSEEELFILTLSALKNIEKENEYLALLEYILKFIYFTGEGLTINVPQQKIYFDKTIPDFVSGRTANSVEIDKKVYLCIYKVSQFGMQFTTDIPDEFSDSTIKQALRLMNNIFLDKYNAELKSFEFI